MRSLPQLAVRRGEERDVERLPGHLPLQRLRQALLDLRLNRGPVHQSGPEQHHGQHRGQDDRPDGVGRALHAALATHALLQNLVPKSMRNCVTADEP
jgi:hypothetical protein